MQTEMYSLNPLRKEDEQKRLVKCSLEIMVISISGVLDDFSHYFDICLDFRYAF